MPKIPNPFDKPKSKKGYAFKPLGMPKRKAGTDTRPNEREPKRVAPRQRMPKELESMLSKRLPKDMPKNRLPQIPKNMIPKDMPKNRPRKSQPRKAQPKRGY